MPDTSPAASAAPDPAAPDYAGPAGPFETEADVTRTAAVQAVFAAFDADPGVGKMRPMNHRMLDEACTAAGIELGAYDHQILLWLASWEPQACAVIAGIITRAHQAGEEQPARHPQVTFTNAITSCPTEYLTRCYPDTQAAFEAAVTERPYNNTSLSLGWCTENHDQSPGGNRP